MKQSSRKIIVKLKLSHDITSHKIKVKILKQVKSTISVKSCTGANETSAQNSPWTSLYPLPQFARRYQQPLQVLLGFTNKKGKQFKGPVVHKKKSPNEHGGWERRWRRSKQRQDCATRSKRQLSQQWSSSSIRVKQPTHQPTKALHSQQHLSNFSVHQERV